MPLIKVVIYQLDVVFIVFLSELGGNFLQRYM